MFASKSITKIKEKCLRLQIRMYISNWKHVMRTDILVRLG